MRGSRRYRLIKPLDRPVDAHYRRAWHCPSCGWQGSVRTKPGKNHRAYIPGRGARVSGPLPRPIRVYWPLTPGWRGNLPWRTCPHPWHTRYRTVGRPGYGHPAETKTTINLRVDTTERRSRRAQRHKASQGKARR